MVNAANNELPTLRWGILGCGLISSWFVSDLCLERAEAAAKHTITAIGSSSKEKGSKFVAEHCSTQSPSIYDSYSGVYNDPNVDIVYIGTPHPMHYKNVLDAIAAGKHVLCEKPMAMNAQQGKEMADAARNKNVFLMEAVWTRFFPLAKELQRLIHEEKAIGDVAALWVDFGLYMPIGSMNSSSRTASKALGAGALLDIGIYSLTWASMIMDTVKTSESTPEISASMLFSDAADPAERVDEQVTAVLRYPSQKAQAICTASLLYKSPETFARIEGSKGTISIGGLSASKPGYLIIKKNGEEERKVDFDVPGIGFHYEADAVALDIHAGRLQNETCPLDTTLSILSQMDRIMAACGLSY
ncbi:Nn.00g061520.m01.CDS01 [Neocucurbitaria sp. VM-36]